MISFSLKSECYVEGKRPLGQLWKKLQKLRKLLPTKTGLAQNRPQGTFGNLFVIRNRQAAEWRGWVAQDDVASRLMVNSVTNFL